MYKYLVLFYGFVLLPMLLQGQKNTTCAEAIPLDGNVPITGPLKSILTADSPVFSSDCFDNSKPNYGQWYTFRTNFVGQLGFHIKSEDNIQWGFALFKASDCDNLGAPIRCAAGSDMANNDYAGIGQHPLEGSKADNYVSWLRTTANQTYYLWIGTNMAQNKGFSLQFYGQLFLDHPEEPFDSSLITNLLGSPIIACEGKEVVLNALEAEAQSYAWSVDLGEGNLSLPETKGKLLVLESGVYAVVADGVESSVQVQFVPKAKEIDFLPDMVQCEIPKSDGLAVFDLGQMDRAVLGRQQEKNFRVSYHNSLVDAQLGKNPLPKFSYQNVNPYGETIYVRKASAFQQFCPFEISSFELVVVDTPEFDIAEKVGLCAGKSVRLGDAEGSSLYTYAWSTGETSPTIEVSKSGIYEVVVSNIVGEANCSISMNVEVEVYYPPVLTDVEIQSQGSSNSLLVQMKQHGAYLYSLDGEVYQEEPEFFDVESGAYTLHIKDENGCGTLTENIVVAQFLSVFTPNGDGINDFWHLKGIERLNSPIVYVFDRYGKLLTKMDRDSPGWDGNYEGMQLPESDYWFRLEYLASNGNKAEAKYLGSHFSLRR
ncbi:MAG: T9SS type B sorting domain-containing protein [Flavobacteriaceae bacterium]|nr:T9SS type B sorting domain-containing protein [Flavobacteriaceae bacterium]